MGAPAMRGLRTASPWTAKTLNLSLPVQIYRSGNEMFFNIENMLARLNGTAKVIIACKFVPLHARHHLDEKLKKEAMSLTDIVRVI